MKWEELTTPEMVLSAFEAGRRLEHMPQKCIRTGWLLVGPEAGPEQLSAWFSCGDIFRALIEEPTIPAGFAPWAGGECPEDARGKRVTYAMRCWGLHDRLADEDAENLRWSHDGTLGDIIAYLVESEQPKPEPAKAAPDYRAILIDVAGNLRRMLDDEFSECDHERANAVMERINNAISAPAPAPSDVEALALSVGADRLPAEPEAGIVSVYWEFSDAQLHEFARRLRPRDTIELDIDGIGRCQLQVRDGVACMPAVTVRDILGRSGLIPQVDDAMVERFVDAYVPDLPDPRVAIRDALTAALNPEADNG